jgi:ArsR family transcriptional regulator, arsenate/arsenite/antimonite-responsive transcriptional repressor / arsenate reductase (thioredoxin)
METEDAAFAFAALGQPSRLELLRCLLEAGPNGLAAGEAAQRLGLPPSTLSFHLRALQDSGLIAPTRQGRHLIYAPQLARLRALLAFLAEACCGGAPERCGDLGRLLNAITREKNDMEHSAFNVLFLCTHNSARSIIAEAILDKLGRPRFEGWSAGSDPRPEGPLPEVLSLLKTLGHDISELRSKSWNELTGPDAPRMDFVITLCDTIQGQACPDFGETTVTGAWPLPDPSKFTGSPAERATLLNEVYAGLRRRLEAFMSLPVASLDKMALKARVDELADPHAVSRA